jgi:hypothetical protein
MAKAKPERKKNKVRKNVLKNLKRIWENHGVLSKLK